ncbi:hypothetical protein WJX74_001507 [Apatococcus lobatus]|uniref:Calponin-homology (CH) domain-containing protein n=1 Tax=Apatococcus lobatus TaxID=904363 RepID=A0AAW1RAR8_9CHLO
MGNGQGRPADIELTSTVSPEKPSRSALRRSQPGRPGSTHSAAAQRHSGLEGRGHSSWREALLSWEDGQSEEDEGGRQGHLSRQMCHRSKSETFAFALNLAGGSVSSADTSLTRANSTTPYQTPSKPARRSTSSPLSHNSRRSPLQRAGSNPDVPWSGVGMGRASLPAFRSGTARANSLASLALNVVVPEVVPEADSEASFMSRSESRSALSTASEQERERLTRESQDGLGSEPLGQEEVPEVPKLRKQQQQWQQQQQQAGLSQFQLARQALRKQQQQPDVSPQVGEQHPAGISQGSGTVRRLKEQMDAAAGAATGEQVGAAAGQAAPEPAARPTFEEELAFCCAYATGLLQGVDDPAVQTSLPLHPANVSDACSNGYILCKLLQLVAPESLDLRAVNAPPDSTAWVQRISRPTTPDPLGNPEPAAATPSHCLAEPPGCGGSSADARPSEDGSEPLSSLWDQEAMRLALKENSMAGTGHAGPEQGRSLVQSTVNATGAASASGKSARQQLPSEQHNLQSLHHETVEEAADVVPELPHRPSKTALGSFVEKLFRSSTQPQKLTAPRKEHAGMRPGRRRAASDSGTQPQPFMSPFAAIQQRQSDSGGSESTPRLDAFPATYAVDGKKVSADKKEDVRSTVDRVGDTSHSGGGAAAAVSADSGESNSSGRSSSPEPPSTPTQVPPSSRCTAPASPCSTPGHGSAAATAAVTAAGTPRQTAAASRTFTPDTAFSGATTPGGGNGTPLPVSFGGRPLQDGLTTPLQHPHASHGKHDAVHAASSNAAAVDAVNDNRMAVSEQKQQQQHRTFQPRKSEGNFLMEHFLSSPADWFKVKRRQTDAGLGSDRLDSPTKHHPRDFEAVSDALSGLGAMPSQRSLVRELHRRLSTCSSHSSTDALGGPHEAGAASQVAPLGHAEAVENSNLCINAATAAGCSFEAGLDAETVAEGSVEAIAGCLWQIISLHYLQGISLRAVPELIVLLLPGEELTWLAEQPPETVLLRWLNFHMATPPPCMPPGPTLQSLSDGPRCLVAFARLLSQLFPTSKQAPRGGPALASEDLAAEVTRRADGLLKTHWPLPDTFGIAAGSHKLATALAAQLFAENHGLQAAAAQRKEQLSFMQWLTDDSEIPREERVFRMWINSLLPREHQLGSLFGEGMRDGYAFLKAIEAIVPGSVEMRQVHRPPFKPNRRMVNAIENCNKVVEVVKGLLGIPLVNIGGLDILYGQRKLIMGLLWQLMRLHLRRLLQGLVQPQGAGVQLGVDAEDAPRLLSDAELDGAVLTWANHKLAGAGCPRRMRSFSDPDLASGLLLIHLLAALQPRLVNWSLVTAGLTAEERAGNAKYVISLARKLGASVFLLWEDVVEVVPKMILALFTSLMAHDLHRDAPSSRAASRALPPAELSPAAQAAAS